MSDPRALTPTPRPEQDPACLDAGFGRLLRRASAFPIVALALGAIALVGVVCGLQALHRRVEGCDRALALADQAERMIVDAQLSVRGYLLSGNRGALASFAETERHVADAMDQLRAQVADEPEQQQRLVSIEALLRLWERHVQAVASATDSAPSLWGGYQTAEGYDLTVDIRSRLHALMRAEDGSRERWSARLDALARGALVAAILVALLLGPIIGVDAARKMLRVRREYAGALAAHEQATRTLRAREEELRQADRRKDEFLGMLSHELRNPLAPIRNAIFVLDHVEPGSERASRALRAIARQTEHLTLLVDELLDARRIQTGKLRLHRERMDLTACLRILVEDAQSLFTEHQVALSLEAPPGELWLDGDRTRLTQLFGNLLQNAAKFTDRGGHVRVRIEPGARHLRVSVHDDGVGIPAELLGTVFEAFVQGDRTLERSNGGLGLGLALVRGIADLHGGSVAVRSEGPGRGSEFTVSLPRSGAIAAAPQLAAAC